MAAASGKKKGKLTEPEIRVLNLSHSKPSAQLAATEISKCLQKLMLRMKGEVMTEDGKGVNYEEMGNSELYSQYKQQAAALRDMKMDTLNEAERKAFFINIYNALTIHGLMECSKLPSSVLDVQLFWKTTAYNISGLVFSLDDIEHGIIRGNRPHPAAKDPLFKDGDPRLKYVIKDFDPRIHFALVCGAKSCPAINVYSAANLDKALDGATRNFCEQEVTCSLPCKDIAISRIFQWYRKDFGENDVAAVRWTLPYLSPEKQKDLQLLLRRMEEVGQVELRYSNYDWRLNSFSKHEPQFENIEPL